MIGAPSDEQIRDFARAGADWAWEADDKLRLTKLCDRFARTTGVVPSALIGKSLSTLVELSTSETNIFNAPIRDVALDLGKAAGVYVIAGEARFRSNGEFAGYTGTAVRQGGDPRVQSAFLSNLNHELRTPLNAIIGYAEAMDGEIFGPMSGRYSGYARDIARAGRHLLSLVEDILDASAIERGDVRVEQSRISVPSVIEKAESLVSVDAETRNVTLIRKPVSQGLAVIADERRLCQILVNLLGNAIKFTPPGGSVSLSAHMLDDARVAIEVTDTGPGIATHDQQRIFEKFERLQVDPFIHRDGVGLGLAISRDLALMMEGTLGVDSTLGEGATFTLTLPAA